MNLDRYKALRASQEKALAEQGREICWTCRRPEVRCLCGLIQQFATRAHFVILIHPMEARKEKFGTGRLTAACLENGRLVKGIDFTNHPEVNALIEDEAYMPMLLYPGEKAFNLSKEPLESLPLPAEKKLLVFVVDGTWTCAKKMMRLSQNLQRLPRLCFTPNRPSEFAIKQQPHEFCLSTIESIHRLLDEMDRTGFDSLGGVHGNLLDVFYAMVDFQVECAADPERPGYRRKLEPKPAADRKPSTKYLKRNIIFEG